MKAHLPEFSGIRLLTEAYAFAADKHRHQRRKDVHASPYINHPIQIVHILTSDGGIENIPTLAAAILHDTIEDTEATVEELRERFGGEIASIVQEVTDDKSLPKDVRKRLQIEHARTLSHKAKLVKLADLISNVEETLDNASQLWSYDRRMEYIEWASRVVHGLRGISPTLEKRFDTLYARRVEIVDKQFQ